MHREGGESRTLRIGGQCDVAAFDFQEFVMATDESLLVRRIERALRSADHGGFIRPGPVCSIRGKSPIYIPAARLIAGILEDAEKHAQTPPPEDDKGDWVAWTSVLEARCDYWYRLKFLPGLWFRLQGVNTMSQEVLINGEVIGLRKLFNEWERAYTLTDNPAVLPCGKKRGT